jgi:hypothetical protein
MLTVRATLQPNGQVQLPPALAKGRPVPVLVTLLEPASEGGQLGLAAPADADVGSIGRLRALLESPEFVALPPSDPQEVDARIQALRNDWNDA